MSTTASCTELLSNVGNFTEVCNVLDTEVAYTSKICGSLKYTAVSSSTTLTILNLQEGKNAVIAEIDFDFELVSNAWDISSECVVVGDAASSIHLVTSEGSLLFSKKLPCGESVSFVCG